MSWGDEAFGFPWAELQGHTSSSVSLLNFHAFWEEGKGFVSARLPSLYIARYTIHKNGLAYQALLPLILRGFKGHHSQ